MTVRSTLVLWVVMMSAIGVTGIASATVPTQVQYQGLLLDSGGTPLTGAVNLDFELFDAITAGTSLWIESHSGVSVVDGVYGVDLGSITPFDSSILATASAFLEVTVDGETLTPRQQLLAVPFALVAESLGTIESGFVEQLLLHGSFDGGGPGNFDPQEGLADVDGDGIANFIDSDNDGDGLSDSAEVGAGSDINLVTPTIASFSPTTANGFPDNTITVSGTNLSTVASVQFGTASPSPTSVTSTSFDVLVPGVQPEGTANVLVTLANGEVANSTYDFFLVTPTITSLTPNPILNDIVTSITVTGTDFIAGTTVEVSGSPIVPTSLMLTSLTIDVGPLAVGDHPVAVIHPNGQDATTILTVNPFVPKTVFVTSTAFPGDFGGIAVADASCQSLASGAGLTGTYKAWLSDSSTSPASSFTLDVGPYRLPDGTTVVADSFVDLTDGTLDHAIDQTETGATVSFGLAWTATGADGLHHLATGDCSDWTALTSEPTLRGVITGVVSFWTEFTVVDCSLSGTHQLYCFEQ